MKKTFVSYTLFLFLIVCCATPDREVHRTINAWCIGFGKMETVSGMQVVPLFWQQPQRVTKGGKALELGEGGQYIKFFLYPPEKIPQDCIGRIIDKRISLKYRIISDGGSESRGYSDNPPIVSVISISF